MSLAQAAQDVEWSRMANIGTLALFIYDILLTFSDEVELVWLHKVSPGSVLYYLARYTTLLAVGLDLATIFLLSDSPDSKTCTAINALGNILALPSFIGVQGLVIALPYALFVSNRVVIFIFIFLTGLGLIPIAMEIALYSNCNLSNKQQHDFKNVLFWQGICILSADFLAFGTTTYQIIRRSAARAAVNRQTGMNFGYVLIRQAALRGFVLLITIVALVVQKTATNQFIELLLLPFQNTMLVLLLCRFSLDLRRDMIGPRELPVPLEALALSESLGNSAHDLVGFGVTLTARSSTTANDSA